MNIVYNRDCMKAMKEYPDKYFELAIVDPPYGNNDAIGLKDNKNASKQATQRTNYKIFENKAPDEEYFKELKRVSVHQIIWGANFFGIRGGYLCWNKEGTVFGEAELAYCSMFNSVRICKIRWNGMLQENMKNKEERIHPTQKPVELYGWLLNNYAKFGDKILDTHVGSGSSRIAAHKLGFDFTGYELDKDYWEAQEERYQDYIKQGGLFD